MYEDHHCRKQKLMWLCEQIAFPGSPTLPRGGCLRLLGLEAVGFNSVSFLVSLALRRAYIITARQNCADRGRGARHASRLDSESS